MIRREDVQDYQAISPDILIIAGKTEGFEYKDADIFGVVNDVLAIRKEINRLKLRGYKIFILTVAFDRDDSAILGGN